MPLCAHGPRIRRRARAQAARRRRPVASRDHRPRPWRPRTRRRPRAPRSSPRAHPHAPRTRVGPAARHAVQLHERRRAARAPVGEASCAESCVRSASSTSSSSVAPASKRTRASSAARALSAAARSRCSSSMRACANTTSAFSVSSSASSTVCWYCASAPARRHRSPRCAPAPGRRRETTSRCPARPAGFAVALEQRAAVEGLRADQAPQRQAREQIGRGHADARGGGMQALLGRGDVGAPAQQVARRAGIEPTGSAGKVPARSSSAISAPGAARSARQADARRRRSAPRAPARATAWIRAAPARARYRTRCRGRRSRRASTRRSVSRWLSALLRATRSRSCRPRRSE